MSREAVLARIRSALAPRAPETARVAAVEARLRSPPAPLVPERARLPVAERRIAFEAQLAAQGTEVIAVARPELVCEAIAAYLRGRALPMRLRRGTDIYLASLAAVTGLDVSEGPATDETPVGLSRAVAGVAETGTLVLASGADNPVTLAFVPETHIVVLARSAIVGSYEEALGLIEEAGVAGALARPGPLARTVLPRTVNFITGASRTGDIGGRIVMGAHGPRRLAVVIVEED